MKAIITVIGKDSVGILGKVSTACSEVNANILEVTQSVLQDMFAMVMLVECGETISVEAIKEKLDTVAVETKTKIHVMHEDIFNSMHKI